MNFKDDVPKAAAPHESASDELVRTLHEALEYANAARHYDVANEIQLACEQYDKSILYIDEVLGKLSSDTLQYSKLLTLRNSYDDRMEFLKHSDSSKPDSVIMTKKNISSNQKKRMSQMAFKEDERLLDFCVSSDKPIDALYEEEPQSSIRIPYWQMRLIRKSISAGAFLTPSVFIPECVWSQVGVKFCGLSIKTSAFQAIIAVVREINFIGKDRFERKISTAFLTSFLFDLKNANGELKSLQNQLSKPFLFIREVAQEDLKSPTIKGQVALSRFTSIVATIGKSVISFAEVGYQRLGTMATRVSEEDFAAFIALTSHLCDRCQVFDENQAFIESEMKLLTMPATGHLELDTSDADESRRGSDSTMKSGVFSDDSSDSDSSVVVSIEVDERGGGHAFDDDNLSDKDSPHSYDTDGVGHMNIPTPPSLSPSASPSASNSSSPSESNSPSRRSNKKHIAYGKERRNGGNKLELNVINEINSEKEMKITDIQFDNERKIGSNEIGNKVHANVKFAEERNRLQLLQEILFVLTSISDFMRDVVCEILLRDAESLTLRYLQKTRKSFSRMYWDEDTGQKEESAGILDY